MIVIATAVIAVTICGALLLGWMYRRDDSRFGMAGLAALMLADVLAMVYAALDQ